VLARISWAKNHMIDPQEYYLQSADPRTERIAHIFEVYRRELRKANALDFDDLLLETVRLLKSSSEVREKYNRKYRYLLIDEYQDTNRPQYELMKALAGEEKNVCVVGDEDQSIYSWRGADIKNILEFERDFPGSKTIRLEQNYRSTQVILQAASAVVANNTQRKGKTLWTDRQGGAKIGYYEAPDGENESLFIADYIDKFLKREQHEDREEPPRVAVLYRTNSQSRLFEEALRRYQLKYNVVGGFSFYDRAEIKDMISYLKLVQNPDDYAALNRVINVPTRGIGKQTLETLERLALETGKSLWGVLEDAVEQRLLAARAVVSLKHFKEIIDDARAMLYGKFAERLTATVASEEAVIEAGDTSFAPGDSAEEEGTDFNFGFDFGAHGEDYVGATPASPSDESPEKVEGFRAPGESANISEVLKFLLDRTGYIKALEVEGTPEAISRIENLQELTNAARDSRDRGETLDEFLDHAALVSDVDQYDKSASITLMTLHAAKGLEFPLVFLVGLEEGLFPSSRTMMDPEGLEEERRLAYVGMTRAMDALILTRARYRRRYGTDMPEASVPSRFLEEVPAALIEEIGAGSSRAGRASPERSRMGARGGFDDHDFGGGTHYSYEDEDQSQSARVRSPWAKEASPDRRRASAGSIPMNTYNSVDNIAEFFASRGKKFARPKMDIPEATGKKGFKPGQRVRHPKYGEGTVYQREGEGDTAKLTVSFPRFGLKKLVEKFAQLEKV
jgi:DNA helicase-2/ATP-dependent DNA helicase PcrA